MAVALVEEGVRLREADVDVPILVLSEPTLEEMDLIVAFGLTPTAYRSSFVDLLADVAENATTLPYPVHLKLDTGMHRVGRRSRRSLSRSPERSRQMSDSSCRACSPTSPWLTPMLAFTARQNDALLSFVEALNEEGIHPKLLHAANTAAALRC